MRQELGAFGGSSLGFGDDDWKCDDAEVVLDRNYHNPALDDLGQTYRRGARAELRSSSKVDQSEDLLNEVEDEADGELLVEYLRRLNPNIVVSSVERSSLLEQASSSCCDNNDDDKDNHVFLCMDRPYATQVTLNRLSRRQNWAFVAVETAGVFGRVFCDFGPTFRVHDADGETPGRDASGSN